MAIYFFWVIGHCFFAKIKKTELMTAIQIYCEGENIIKNNLDPVYYKYSMIELMT